MGQYDRQVATALRLIKAKGEACTWRAANEPDVADPTKPWIITETKVTESNVSIVFTSSMSNPLLRFLPASNVEGSGAEGIMPAVAFTPTLSDSVVRSDGTVLQLSRLTPVAPNGQVIIWKMEFK